MDKKIALALSSLLTFLLFSNIYLFTLLFQDNQQKREIAVLKRVIDGDTIELEDGRIIRLLNINSPEKSSPLYNVSRGFIDQYVNKSIEIEIVGIDKYSRNLARIYSEEYLNLKIVDLGLASKFLVDKSESKLFSNAELRAIESSRGMWKKSEFFGCFSTEINPKEEEVKIRNICAELNLKNWILKDESRKVYKFQNLSFHAINLHSGDGNDNSTDIFWKSKTHIWNNDADSLYLFDEKGNIAHYDYYGY